MDLKLTSTVIFCNDLQEQRNFYEKFLGQTIKYDFDTCLIFENNFTLWKLKKDYPVSRELGYTYEPIGNRNLEVCFETELFEDAVENILMADLRMLHNVAEEAWGQYTIRFYDPEGNLVEIGETLGCMARRMLSAGMSVGEISTKSGLPESLVEDLVKE